MSLDYESKEGDQSPNHQHNAQQWATESAGELTQQVLRTGRGGGGGGAITHLPCTRALHCGTERQSTTTSTVRPSCAVSMPYTLRRKPKRTQTLIFHGLPARGDV